MSPQLQPLRQNSTLQLVQHLDAAYNLARWLTRDEHDTEDIVQEAYLRAFQHLPGFRGGNGRAWLLTIVRNCCYDFFRRHGMRRQDGTFDEEIHAVDTTADDPEAALLAGERAELLRYALTQLPPSYREILILRELEELSYKEIAGIVGLPLGTVMSRLSRARNQLQQSLTGQATPARMRPAKINEPKERSQHECSSALPTNLHSIGA